LGEEKLEKELIGGRLFGFYSFLNLAR